MNERFESGYLPASHKILWVVLRVGLLAWGTYGLFHGSVVEFLEAIFAIIFTHLWDFFQIFGGFSFITRVDYLTQTMLNLFIFIGVVVGSTLNNRTAFSNFDIVTHFSAGFISAWFAYDFACTVQGPKRRLSPALAALFVYPSRIVVILTNAKLQLEEIGERKILSLWVINERFHKVDQHNHDKIVLHDRLADIQNVYIMIGKIGADKGNDTHRIRSIDCNNRFHFLPLKKNIPNILCLHQKTSITDDIIKIIAQSVIFCNSCRKHRHSQKRATLLYVLSLSKSRSYDMMIIYHYNGKKRVT